MEKKKKINILKDQKETESNKKEKKPLNNASIESVEPLGDLSSYEEE